MAGYPHQMSRRTSVVTLPMDPDDSIDFVRGRAVALYDHEGHEHGHVSTALGRTLLPGPVASAVSFATRSTSFAIRAGTVVGSYGLYAAKLTTLSSLELGRSVLEGILSRSGRDVVAQTRSAMGRDSAETILERSLEAVHQAMMQAVFWTTAGFQVTETTASTVSQISQLLLSVLDQFFGSTDSSRAMASIIVLIRREFQNPATGVQGEKVGLMDIILGLCGLAYLQSLCRKMIHDEIRRSGQEEIIWDVVLLNDGERVDVHEDSLYGVHRGSYATRTPKPNDGIIEAIEHHGAQAQESSSDDELPEIHLKRQIMGSLPDDANVSISTSTTTTKIITVEIKGSSELPLLAPPGADMIESEIMPPESHSPGFRDASPTYRVVYRISRNTVRNTEVQPGKERDDGARSRVEDVDDGADGGEDSNDDGDSSLSLSDAEDRPPPVPPKTPQHSTMSPPQVKISDVTTRAQRSSSFAGSVGSNTASSPRDRSSHIPLPKPTSENAANQKKQRQPPSATKTPSGESQPVSRNSNKAAAKVPREAEPAVSKSGEKRGGLRNAFKKGSVTGLAGLLGKDTSNETMPGTQEPKSKPKSSRRPPWGSNKPPQGRISNGPARGPMPDRTSSITPARDAPRAPQRGNPNYFSSRDLGTMDEGTTIHPPRNQSRSSYIAVHHQRRNSVISQTDTFSIHSYESRPGSPVMYRSDQRTGHHMNKSKSGNDIVDLMPPSPQRHHQRAKSQMGSLYTPSIYTLKASGSQTSLVLSSFHHKSAYSDSEALDTLRRTGMVDGMFPSFHILRNITRYSRYASAAYGSHFLKFMGIGKEMPVLKALDETHHDVRSFAHHTELPPDSILLSSFVDPQGGSDSTGSTETGMPLVHTIAVDEESKAVVLSCRGTLGFEDVLADMMCDYDEMLWRGKKYQVHKGVHASARRLLYGGDGRVLVTLKEALEEFPDYGLVLCGHSLGGGVTALLGAMLAEPATTGTAFVTSAQQHKRLLTDGLVASVDPAVCLPPGRPIHVYAYGPPATMSPSLQKATRGLITSVVQGNDCVPYFSLGVLHDFQALALAFKSDNSAAKAEVRRRIWEGLQSGIANKWYNNAPKVTSDEEGQWAYAALKTLRVSMVHPKLLPPGEVFAVESSPAIRREAFLQTGEEQIGRPATRIVLKYIRDVETRFKDLRFGSGMMKDHSPGKYEDALRRLTLGVLES